MDKTEHDEQISNQMSSLPEFDYSSGRKFVRMTITEGDQDYGYYQLSELVSIRDDTIVHSFVVTDWYDDLDEDDPDEPDVTDKNSAVFWLQNNAARLRQAAAVFDQLAAQAQATPKFVTDYEPLDRAEDADDDDGDDASDD
jgi:hypothetical protein